MGPLRSASVYGIAASTSAATTRRPRSSSQVLTSELGAGCERCAEDRPEACPDGIGVVEVGDRVGGDHGIGARAVGAPEDGAEVAGLLEALEDDDEGIRRQLQQVESEPGDRDDGDEPLRPIPEGQPLSHGLVDEDGRHRRLAEGLDGRAALGGRDGAGADHGLLDPSPGGESTSDLAGAIDEGQLPLVAAGSVTQAEPRPDARIRRAREHELVHRRHRIVVVIRP